MPAEVFSTDVTVFNRKDIDFAHLLSGPFWGELRMFLAVAKTRSQSQAADLLNTTQPTVGRAVKRLEDLIGAQLTVQSPRGVVLTERGLILANLLSKIDHELYSMTALLQAERRELEGVVRISVTEGLCGFCVAPAVPGFSQKHPKIRLELLTPRNVNDLRENQCDIMVAFTPGDSADLSTRAAGTLHLLPIVAHSYIKRCGMPSTSNLADHAFVDNPIYQSTSPLWRAWQSAVRQGYTAFTCENAFPYGLLIRSGLGIGLLGNYATAETALVPLDLGFTVELPLYVVALSDRLRARPVQVVFDWLTQVVGPNSPWLADMDDPHLVSNQTLQDTLERLLPSGRALDR